MRQRSVLALHLDVPSTRDALAKNHHGVSAFHYFSSGAPKSERRITRLPFVRKPIVQTPRDREGPRL